MTNRIIYRTPCKVWSASDYAILINHDLGWVSDCGCYWEFACAKDLHKFKSLQIMPPLASIAFLDLPYKVHVSQFTRDQEAWCLTHATEDNSWDWWLEINPDSGEDFTVFGFSDEDLAMQFRMTF